MNVKWERRGLIRAAQVSKFSKDPVRFEGAVLWDHEHVPIMESFNGQPHNIQDIPKRLANPAIRALLSFSAIDNVLWLATKHAPERVPGSTLYCYPLAPTVREAALIIRARCARVMYSVHSELEEAPKLTSYGLLRECGIECVALGNI